VDEAFEEQRANHKKLQKVYQSVERDLLKWVDFCWFFCRFLSGLAQVRRRDQSHQHVAAAAGQQL